MRNKMGRSERERHSHFGLRTVLFFLLLIALGFNNVLGYSRNNKNLLNFTTCGDFIHQRISLIHATVVGFITDRVIMLPSQLILDDGTSVAFEDVYNLDFLKTSIESLNMMVVEHKIYAKRFSKRRKTDITSYNMGYSSISLQRMSRNGGGIMALACAFNSVKVEEYQHKKILWQIDEALQFSDKILKEASKVLAKFPKGFTALNFPRNTTELQQDNAFFKNMLDLNRVPKELPLYITGGTTLEDIKLCPQLRFIVEQYDVHIAATGPYQQIIEFEVSRNASLSLSADMSAFSSMVYMYRRQKNKKAVKIVDLPEIHFPLRSIEMKELSQKLKWVFAMTLDDRSNTGYLEMAQVAVLSCRKHTTLQPFAIISADLNSTVATMFIKWLQNNNVQIIMHQPKWKEKMLQFLDTPQARSNTKYSPLYAKTQYMVATFLRIDIPILGFTDEYLLYADVDVLFIREVTLKDFQKLPKYYIMTVERQVTPTTNPFDTSCGNAGIMLYNMVNMRATYDIFLGHIFSNTSWNQGLHFMDYGPGDQGAYNSFYREKYQSDVRLMSSYNWRPYWKDISAVDNRQPAIVHWHGPKPRDYLSYYKDENTPDVIEGFKALMQYNGCDRNNIADSCWRWSYIWYSYLAFVNSELNPNKLSGKVVAVVGIGNQIAVMKSNKTLL